MSVNISDYYQSILARINPTQSISSVTSQKAASGTNSTGTSTDKLDLSSSTGPTGFLNYNSTGNYTSLPTLADFLGKDSSNSAAPSSLDGQESTGQSDSLLDMLNNEDSSDSSVDDSMDGMFDSLARDNTLYADYLVQQALDKVPSTQPKASVPSSTIPATEVT